MPGWLTESTVPLRGCVLWLAAVLVLPGVLLPGTPASAAEPPATTEELPAALRKTVPENLTDLRQIEQAVRRITDQIRAATVGVRLGNAHGSGVIIGNEGYVLTAAHVIGRPGRKVELRLNDGQRISGRSLGIHREIDAGLIQIDEPEGLPSVPMGTMDSVKAGDWCIAVGHPGGFREDRTPVVRLGRVLLKRDHVIQTDCTLVGGDSGGPLFNLRGEVIGINSRIGRSTSWNFHVPVSAWKGKDWDRLAAGDIVEPVPKAGKVDNSRSERDDDDEEDSDGPRGAVLGINGEDHEQGCRVTVVAPGYPAETAGLKVGDVITHLDGKEFEGFQTFAALIRAQRPGSRVRLTVLREGETLNLTATLRARRPSE